jgi:hypothetical protein
MISVNFCNVGRVKINDHRSEPSPYSSCSLCVRCSCVSKRLQSGDYIHLMKENRNNVR